MKKRKRLERARTVQSLERLVTAAGAMAEALSGIATSLKDLGDTVGVLVHEHYRTSKKASPPPPPPDPKPLRKGG